MSHPQRNVPLRLQALAAMFAASLGITTQSHAASAGPTVHISVSEAGDFQKALTALADKGNVTFVAEGVPMHPLLSSQKAAELAVTSSLNDEVDAIAKAYDYAVQREGNLFVLRKRYSDLNDLPALTQAECAHALREMQKVAAPFNPHTSVDSQTATPDTNAGHLDSASLLTGPFVNSLTGEQLSALQSGRLFVSSLSTEQQSFARRILLHIYVQGPISVLTPALALMDRAEADATLVQRNPNTGRQEFGYTFPEKAGVVDPVPFHPLSQFKNRGDLYGIVLTPSHLRQSALDSTEPEQTLDLSTTSQTIGSVVASISHSHVEVNAAVAAKPVTVVGTSAPVSAVIQAMAEVYGLRLSNDRSQYVLKLRDTVPPHDVEDLPTALQKTLPEPLARAMHLEDATAGISYLVSLLRAVYDTHSAPPIPGVEETPAQLEEAKRKREASLALVALGRKKYVSDYTDEVDGELSQIRITAIRRLRTLIKPVLQTNPDGVATSSMGQPERDALATVFVVEAAQAVLRPLLQPMPQTFSRFNQVVLSGGVYEDNGRSKFRLFFGLPLPNGQMAAGPGISGIDYGK